MTALVFGSREAQKVVELNREMATAESGVITQMAYGELRRKLTETVKTSSHTYSTQTQHVASISFRGQAYRGTSFQSPEAAAYNAGQSAVLATLDDLWPYEWQIDRAGRFEHGYAKTLDHVPDEAEIIDFEDDECEC